MRERWINIPNTNKKIKLSSFGRVYSVKRKKYLGWNNSEGYRLVNIKGKEYLVHRLVATYFLTNPYNRPCVDHKDTNPNNNIITNLRWVTYAQNNANPITRAKALSETNRQNARNRMIGNTWAKGYKHTDEWKQMMSDRNKGKVLCKGYKHTDEWKREARERMLGNHYNDINKIPIIVDESMYFDSITDACKTLNLRRSRVGEILRGTTKRYTHKGHTFKYATSHQYKESDS